MIEPIYIYRAVMMPREKQARMDGDTYWMDVDLGLRVHSQCKLRLRNYSCPERDAPKGMEAGAYALKLLYAAKTIVVQTYHDRLSHDRWVADIWLDGVLLGESLLKAGYATYTPM